MRWAAETAKESSSKKYSWMIKVRFICIFSGYTENTWSSDEFNIFIFHLRFSKIFSQDFCVYLNFKSLQHPNKTSIWSDLMRIGPQQSVRSELSMQMMYLRVLLTSSSSKLRWELSSLTTRKSRKKNRRILDWSPSVSTCTIPLLPGMALYLHLNYRLFNLLCP